MGYLNDLINSGRLKSPNPMQAFASPAAPASIAAPEQAPPQLSYDSPAVTTMPYQVPYQQAPQAPAPNNWPTGGGGGNPAAETPAPPPPPRKTEEEIKAMAEVDSTFMDQKSMYAKALKNYVDDYTRQKGGLELDAKTAKSGIERNREVGLTGLSEDFSARGLGRSGMFIDNLGKADQQYDKQRDNVTTGLTNSVGDLDFRKSKFVAENGENGSNIQAARREAYARLAAAQNLV